MQVNSKCLKITWKIALGNNGVASSSWRACSLLPEASTCHEGMKHIVSTNYSIWIIWALLKTLTFSSDIMSISWFLDILDKCIVKGSLPNPGWFSKPIWVGFVAIWAPPSAPAMTFAAAIATGRPIGCWRPEPGRSAWPPTCFWVSVAKQYIYK